MSDLSIEISESLQAGDNSTKLLKVAMVAGEASGDMLASLLLKILSQKWNSLDAFGIGGPNMESKGFRTWWPSEKLAVQGFGLDVLWRYREIVGIRNKLYRRLIKNPPNIFIGIDAPDFNLNLETALKSQGIKVIHFVSPSFWAWRENRVKKLKNSVDHVLCLFPFEPNLLAEHGVPATFIGHPLANIIPQVADRQKARRFLKFNESDDVVAILPGSRRSEILYLASPFFLAARLLLNHRPNLKLIVPAIPAWRVLIEEAAKKAGIFNNIQILTGNSHNVLEACDVALVASGTATLEAALFKRPMVIAYKMSWLSWQIMKRKKIQPWIGLPNILSQSFVVPELLQDAVTPENLEKEISNWLDAKSKSPEKIHKLEGYFSLMHSSLQCNTAELAVNAIKKIIEA